MALRAGSRRREESYSNEESGDQGPLQVRAPAWRLADCYSQSVGRAEQAGRRTGRSPSAFTQSTPSQWGCVCSVSTTSAAVCYPAGAALHRVHTFYDVPQFPRAALLNRLAAVLLARKCALIIGCAAGGGGLGGQRGRGYA